MTSQADTLVFDFNDAFATLVAEHGQASQIPLRNPSEEELNQALKAASEAAYCWTIATDEVVWSANAAEVLGCPAATVATGKQFASLLDPENVTTRYETVMSSKVRDDGRGVPYQIEYAFKSHGRSQAASIWLEDVGRWQAGLDGMPKIAHGTVRRIDERHKRDQKLSFLGNCDPLTGMMNRGRMTEALGEALGVAKKTGNCGAFAIAAVNNLGLVNEAYGYEVADEVIVEVGRRLRRVLRTGDAIARYSGGKFGVILNECGKPELEIALSRLVSVVRDCVIETAHGPVWSTLSIGATRFPEHADAPHAATALAEEALHEASKLPSDGFVVYENDERRKAVRALNARCAAEIVTCLKEDRFKLAFQGIISAKTGEVVMHEALLRMQEADGELIAASHLIPVAEHLGLVRLIDRSVMQLVIQTMHAYPAARLAMNVSGTTATDPHWYEQLLDVINANPTCAPRLTVEITETVALNDLGSTRRFVEKLRKAGCDVAIDDFGAGYTSFRNLRELPINLLKLDGSFCRDLRKNTDNEFLVRSLIDLSAKFKLKTVAEWVETEEDRQALESWGIDYMQGHLWGDASIVPPWPHSGSRSFELAATANGNGETRTPMIQTTAQVTEPETASETVMVIVDASRVDESSTHETQIFEMASTQVSSGPSEFDLDFTELDASIATLRLSLGDLTLAANPLSEQPTTQLPTEQAA